MQDNIITYRGTSQKYYKDYSVCDVFNGKVFYSTSVDYEQALAFANDIALYNDDEYKGVVLEIKVPKNAKCLYIGSNTDFDTNEYELLLSNKTIYKIQSIYK